MGRRESRSVSNAAPKKIWAAAMENRMANVAKAAKAVVAASSLPESPTEFGIRSEIVVDKGKSSQKII